MKDEMADMFRKRSKWLLFIIRLEELFGQEFKIALRIVCHVWQAKAKIAGSATLPKSAHPANVGDTSLELPVTLYISYEKFAKLEWN